MAEHNAVTENTQRQRLLNLSEDLPRQIEACSPRLRAGILLLTNHMLRLAGRSFHPNLATDPSTTPAIAILKCFNALVQSRDYLDEVLEWGGPKESVMRTILATELVMMTIGFPMKPEVKTAMLGCWRTIWKSRENLSEALVSMRAWEDEHGMSAFPLNDDGENPDDYEALFIGNSFPAFMHRGNNKT
jgi:hypothetical protein